MGDAKKSHAVKPLALNSLPKATAAGTNGATFSPPHYPEQPAQTSAKRLDYSSPNVPPPISKAKNPFVNNDLANSADEVRPIKRSAASHPDMRHLRQSGVTEGEDKKPKPSIPAAPTEPSFSASLMNHLWQEIAGGRKELSPETIPWWTTRQVYVTNFFNVPLRLEQFLFFGLLICVDSFLFIFAFLPIRCVLAALTWLGSVFRQNRWKLSSSQQFDLARATIFFLSYFLLNTLDGSYLYHFIRGQASLKLYVIFNLIEIFDKLCCSFGQDIFDYLFATTLSSTSFPSNSSGDTPASARYWRRTARKVGAYSGTLIYTSLHSFLLFVKVVTLNVSVNAYNNSLLTLLVSANFVELKGIVFKSFKTENVFQIACSDAVERFQLLVFLVIICVHNLNDLSWQLTQETVWNIVYIIGIVAGMEVIVDWLKHAFITRFNKMQSSIFQHFERIIALGVVQQDDIPDSCYTTSKRIGFVSLPLACVVFRVFVGVAPISGLAGFLWTFALWATLVVAKFLTSLILLSMSASIIGKTSSNIKSEKLANTYAYDKIE